MLDLFTAVAQERVFIGTEPGFDRERYRKGWHDRVADRSQGAIVALLDDRLVGYVATYDHADYGKVLGMLVFAEHRGRGVGNKLLEAILDWARAEGLAEISLLVFPHNTAAIALYRKFGFVDREYNRNDVTRQSGEVWDTLAMTKRLALVNGTHDPDMLAELARGRLRKKLPALRKALFGWFSPTHRLLVSELLAHIDYLILRKCSTLLQKRLIYSPRFRGAIAARPKSTFPSLARIWAASVRRIVWFLGRHVSGEQRIRRQTFLR